jgi:putative PIN family toxin of toxin-antitoxin system
VKVVLDTDVIVSAYRSPAGASAALLRGIRHGKATMLISTALMLEYEAVCSMAVHRKAAGLTIKETGVFLDALAFIAKPVALRYFWRPQLRDPGDEMVLETAVNGQADALITFNVRDYGVVPGRFGVRLMTPPEFLRSFEK